MKTASDPTSTANVPPLISQAIAQLDEFTQNVPIETMLKELHLVIERLTFHQNTTKKETQLDRQDIESLLGSDVSRSMFDFMVWCTENKLLKLFVGYGGQVFLSYCAKHYRYVGEVVFTTSVELSDTFRFTVSEQLRQMYPFPARLIFKVQPSLVAGFVLTTHEGKTADFSLRKNMLADIAAAERERAKQRKKAQPTEVNNG